MSEENTSAKSQSQGGSGKKPKANAKNPDERPAASGNPASQSKAAANPAKQQPDNKQQKADAKDKPEKRQSLGAQAQAPRQQQQQHPSTGNKASQQQQQAKAHQPSTQSSNTRLALFDHLPRKAVASSSEAIEGDRGLHPATVKIGLMFSKGIIREDDDRVAALLATFIAIVEEYKTPTNKSLTWDLDKHIRAQVRLMMISSLQVA
jgi:hypothetical protein